MTNTIQLDFPIDHQSLLRLARYFSEYEGTCLLYSGKSTAQSSRSFLSLFPFEQIWVYGNQQWIQHFNKTKKKLFLNPWEGLKKLLPAFKTNAESSYPSYFGFFGYEMGHYVEEQHSPTTFEPISTPDSYFQRAALLLIVDHTTGSAELVIEENWKQLLEGKEKECQAMEQLLTPEWWSKFLSSSASASNSIPLSYIFEKRESQTHYLDKVKQIKELIYDGDVYQVNLSQQFILRSENLDQSPFDLFETLMQINPAPYSAYFKLRQFSIVSSSPELFLQKRRDHLLTRPIKGTIARGLTSDQDEFNRHTLLSSIKERAELLMIVDLMRNDLGKISLPGSVETKEIWGCEAYSNVFHLVATINSRPVPHLHPLDLIRNCFPGGSVTGCPKLKAIETIQKMENRTRGIYTGSIGYFCNNGDFEFNIAIRTAIVQEGRIDLQLGGAVVADSDPEREYAETLQKGDSIFKALGLAYATKR